MKINSHTGTNGRGDGRARRWGVGRVALMLAVILSVCLHPAPSVAEVAVIPIGYADGDHLLNIVRPLISPGGSVTYDPHSGSLVVIDTPARIRRIRSVIAAVDRPPVQLLIRVRFESAEGEHQRSARVTGRVNGDGWRVGTDDRPGDGVEATVHDRQRLRTAASEQQLRLASGATGVITTGLEIPLTGDWLRRCRSYGRCVGGIQYHRVETGFDITPEARGQTVRIRMAPRMAAVDNRRWTVGFTRAVVELSVPYGRWVDVGGIAGDANDTAAAVLGQTRGNSSRRTRMMMFIERVQ